MCFVISFHWTKQNTRPVRSTDLSEYTVARKPKANRIWQFCRYMNVFLFFFPAHWFSVSTPKLNPGNGTVHSRRVRLYVRKQTTRHFECIRCGLHTHTPAHVRGKCWIEATERGEGGNCQQCKRFKILGSCGMVSGAYMKLSLQYSGYKMQLIWYLLSNFYLNMFRASSCPSSGEQECALPHTVFCTVSDGCGCVELGRKLWRSLFDSVEQWPSQCTQLSLRPSSTQPQPSLTVHNTVCGSAHSCSPDDGHDDARNMLR